MKDGAASQSLFCGPRGIAFSSRPYGLYVSDTLNHAVRFIKLDKSSSKAISVTTVCGGKDDSRQIRFPDGIVFSEEEKCAIFLNDAGIGKISTSSSSAGKISPSTISPSTMLDDLKRMIGDKTLPQGRVTFVVGPERQRIEHISKNILCVRSEFFMKMFRARSVDVTDDEILLPSENYHAYKELIQYLVTDSMSELKSFDDSIELLNLATNMGISRLASICVASMNLSSLAPADVLSALDTISVLLAKETVRTWNNDDDEEEEDDSDSQGEEDKNVSSDQKKRRAKQGGKNSTLFSLFMETRRAVIKFAKTNPDALRNSLASINRIEICRGVLSDVLRVNNM